MTANKQLLEKANTIIDDLVTNNGRLMPEQAERFIRIAETIPVCTHRVCFRARQDGTRWTTYTEVFSEADARELAKEWKDEKKGTVWWNRIGGVTRPRNPNGDSHGATVTRMASIPIELSKLRFGVKSKDEK